MVDLIKSIGEKTALVDHLEEKILNPDTPSQEELESLIRLTLDLRRSQMDLLLRQGVKPNPLFWCDFKHAIKSVTHDTEVYEATLAQEDFENLKRSSDILAGVTSLFLGMEFATCSRCLYDMMLTKQIEENTSGKQVDRVG